MDFDKLKKAAKDTFKKVTTKLEETLDTDDTEQECNFDDTTDDTLTSAEAFTSEADIEEDEMECTQRFDLKNMLDRFKKKNLNLDVDDLTGEEVEDEDSGCNVNELKTSIDKLDEGISQITSSQSEQIDNLKEQLDAIKADIDDMRENSLDVATRLGNIDDGINLRLGSVEKKLAEIANSVTSVTKLNDSIFDLKNAQINTRNSLTDVEASFTRLKKKMTTSITIISILAAIIAILEIINLLS